MKIKALKEGTSEWRSFSPSTTSYTFMNNQRNFVSEWDFLWPRVKKGHELVFLRMQHSKSVNSICCCTFRKARTLTLFWRTDRRGEDITSRETSPCVDVIAAIWGATVCCNVQAAFKTICQSGWEVESSPQQHISIETMGQEHYVVYIGLSEVKDGFYIINLFAKQQRWKLNFLQFIIHTSSTVSTFIMNTLLCLVS